MQITQPTLATVALVSVAALFAAPVLFHGFRRRGKGVLYEKNFLIQRAPQLASVATIFVIVASFLACNQLLTEPSEALTVFTQWHVVPESVRSATAWAGVLVLFSGLIFMVGGWYSLGECFSTDAEVLDGHTVRKTGLLKYVMHPAYSGIIQSLLGASLACLSLPSVLLTVLVVAPLWLNRAKYEERILLDTLGPSYEEYARELKWRRLVPSFFPIGI
ncbi:MAG TPA: isoprenylcysteine carboxylmethyltransferase family protein [Candidatus Obscuribacterales bacterium]